MNFMQYLFTMAPQPMAIIIAMLNHTKTIIGFALMTNG